MPKRPSLWRASSTMTSPTEITRERCSFIPATWRPKAGLAIDRRARLAVDRPDTLYYNNRRQIGAFQRFPMAIQPHHHPHPVVAPASLLRMSALQRLAVAGGVIVVIWAAVLWAMS